MNREITHLPCDCISLTGVKDEVVMDKLQSLLKHMEDSISPRCIKEYTVDHGAYSDRSAEVNKQDRSGRKEDDDNCTEYLAQWKDHVSATFVTELDRLGERKLQWNLDGCGAGIPGEILGDFLHHMKLCKRKVDAFVGREDLLAEASQRLYEPHQGTDSHSDEQSLRSISFCIIGKSGSGKTSLMSKLSHEAHKREQESGQNRPIVVRFCGTNSESATGAKLMQSICKQLHFCLGITTDIPKSFDELVKYFHSLLREHAILLFIDSLDQLR